MLPYQPTLHNIMAITKQLAKEYHDKLNALHAAFAAEHGLTVVPSRLTYGDTGMKITVEFGDKSSIGDNNPVYVRDLKAYGWQFGITMDHLNKTIKTSKGEVVVQGMKRQYVIVKDTAGKLWKYDAVMVAGLLGVKK